MHPNFEHVTECMKCNREPTFSTPLIQQPRLFSWFWKRKQKISSPHLTSLSTTEKFLQVNTILYSVQLSLLLLLATNQEQEFSGGARALATIQKSFVALRRARVLMMMINHTILFFMVDVVPKRGMTTITQYQGKFHTTTNSSTYIQNMNLQLEVQKAVQFELHPNELTQQHYLINESLKPSTACAGQWCRPQLKTMKPYSSLFSVLQYISASMLFVTSPLAPQLKLLTRTPSIS